LAFDTHRVEGESRLSMEDWEKIEALREGLLALYARVRKLEQQADNGQRSRSAASRDQVTVLAGTGPAKRPRGATRGQQTRVMRSGIR
jgi:hypothetical protein